MIQRWTPRKLLIIIIDGQLIQIERPGHHPPLSRTVRSRATVHLVPTLGCRVQVRRIQVESGIVCRSEYFSRLSLVLRNWFIIITDMTNL